MPDPTGPGRQGHPADRHDGPSRRRGPDRWTPLRRVANLVNLATPAGLLLARAHGVRPRRGPYGLWLATGYPRAFPAHRNPAVTVGDVVLLRLTDEALVARPQLLRHEARHAAQWAVCLGPLGFLPLYGVASLWSWLRTGHPAWANVFETAAGLADGGYRPRVTRSGSPAP